MNQSTLLMALRSCLSGIEVPDAAQGGGNLVAAGRILDMAVEEGRANITLDAGGDSQKQISTLIDRMRAELLEINGIEDVRIIATRHSTGKSAGRSGSPKPSQRAVSGHDNPLGLSDFMAKKESAKPDPNAKIGEALRDVKRIIAVTSGKGGVGKSTMSVSLAKALAASGLRVGLLDADISGPSLPTLLGMSQRPSVNEGKIQPLDTGSLKFISIGLLVDSEKAVAWRGPMQMGAIRQLLGDVEWGALDILLIDTPPGTGDTHLSLIQTGKLDGAVIITTPQELALADVRRGISLFRQTNIPVLGLIENMAWLEMPDGSRTFIFGESGGERMAASLEVPFLGAIPIEPAIGNNDEAGFQGSKSAKKIEQIAAALIDQ